MMMPSILAIIFGCVVLTVTAACLPVVVHIWMKYEGRLNFESHPCASTCARYYRAASSWLSKFLVGTLSWTFQRAGTRTESRFHSGASHRLRMFRLCHTHTHTEKEVLRTISFGFVSVSRHSELFIAATLICYSRPKVFVPFDLNFGDCHNRFVAYFWLFLVLLDHLIRFAIGSAPLETCYSWDTTLTKTTRARAKAGEPNLWTRSSKLYISNRSRAYFLYRERSGGLECALAHESLERVRDRQIKLECGKKNWRSKLPRKWDTEMCFLEQHTGKKCRN